MAHKTLAISREELWLEFKKAIDAGNFRKFKTKRGFNSYILRAARARPGKALVFIFQYKPGHYFEVGLDIKDARR